MEWPHLHHAQFTTKGHSLIIVYKYDIYYRLGPRTYQSFRVTEDAVPGTIYNGIPDWLYEGNLLLCIVKHNYNGFNEAAFFGGCLQILLKLLAIYYL